LLLAGIALAAVAGRPPEAAQREVRWKKTVLDKKFRAEGCAVADVNRDGKPDILVGDVWYEAPDWKPHAIRPEKTYEPATGYSDAFLVFAHDVDRNRWPDQIVIGFPGKEAKWYRNPGKNGGAWTEHVITTSACNESPIFADVDGDGRPELLTPFDEKQMAYYRPGSDPREPWVQTLVGLPDQPGCKRFSHGLGVGDLNGDKRADILVTAGCYQAPAKKGEAWTFVPAKLGPDCAHMYTYDFDGDGDMDVFSSSAHAIGVWWWEQVKGESGPEFKQHVIDQSFSQSHAVMMTDVNGDRKPDFVTGKRWWAHGPNGDVNPNDPAVLYWYEFIRRNGRVEWVRHEIDSDSGVGTGFAVADVNGDKRPDIAVANKKGVFLFLQQ
jgi:hypothetical protein